MDTSKAIILEKIKATLKWVFYCVLYPYIVVSFVYGKGVGFTGLLFSYITIVPTLIVIKSMRVLREKSIDFNECIAEFLKERIEDDTYSNAIIVLKIARKVILTLLVLFSIKLLFDLFNVSSFISPSLSAYLIALLQIYYMLIIITRVRYEV